MINKHLQKSFEWRLSNFAMDFVMIMDSTGSGYCLDSRQLFLYKVDEDFFVSIQGWWGLA